MLTKNKLKELKPGIFAKGTLIDNADNINLAETGNKVKWVAVKGHSEYDWAIYAQNPHYGEMSWNYDKIRDWGDKVFDEKNIKKLVPCDKESFDFYRY